MKIGFIGLGKMGTGMVEHLKEQGVEVVAYNRSPNPNATVKSIEELVASLTPPRTIWIMVSASGVDDILNQLALATGDIIIDGGNSFYKDTVRRNAAFGKRGISYIDCGVSGGVEAARRGACLMIGGDETVVKQLEWLWNALAAPSVIPAKAGIHPTGGALVANENFPPSSEAARTSIINPQGNRVEAGENFVGSPRVSLSSWAYLGPSGAGHFVKMVHNGVEYGMDQAIAEGFAILEKAPYHLDLATVAELWNHGSVVRGWLIELLATELTADPHLEKFIGKIGGGQFGRQALDTAKELGVKTKVLEESLEAREESQTNPTFAGKVVSALRKGYGGHEEA